MSRPGVEFLERERDAWRAYEALGDLSDEELERPTDAQGPGHGWSGRDLIGHVLGWQEQLLQVARELEVAETSASSRRIRAEWARRGDAINARLLRRWRSLPMEEVRKRFHEVPVELRRALAVIPEERWLDDAEDCPGFRWMVEHYEDHRPDLNAVLREAGS